MKRAAQIVLVLGFLATIGAQCYATYAAAIRESDKLRPVYWPGLKLKYAIRNLRDFPDDFTKHFEDRVGWKHLFVRRFARFKMDQLGVSPVPRVWWGDDGWLFFNHEALPEYFAADSPKLDKRMEQWRQAMPEWRAWLAERNIRLLIVVPSDKQSVYTEQLPAIVRKSLPERRVVDDLIDEWHRRDPNLDVLDLRPALAAGKDRQQLYFKTDTHWNQRGSRLGYQATAKHLGHVPHGDEEFDVLDGMLKGDLGEAQLGYWAKGDEPFARFHLKNSKLRDKPVSLAEDEGRLGYLKAAGWERPGQPGPKCIVFHDSFGDGLFVRSLAEHYGELLAVPSNHLDPVIIEREKPAVVILEIVERLFQGIGARRPTDPPVRSMNR